MQVGIFGFESKVDKIVEEVAIAAGQGFASFWVPQIFGVDALTALALIGDPAEIGDRIAVFEDGGMTTFAASSFGNESERAATREFLQGLL